MSLRAPNWEGDAASFAGELLAWLERAGARNYDESVTQFEHALQSAGLAEQRGNPEPLILAALLHDVGHLLVGEHDGREDFLEHDLRHEKIGADWLARAFGPEVTDPVLLHVAAKRYICTVDPGYYERLSASSKRSFAVQGGAMSAREIATFLAHPAAQQALEVRRIDDRAKRRGVVIASAEAYRERIAAALARRLA